eukprot:TRINITY_DN450_c0_g1_i1.p1 TRINITY_DN450_c0_g1~~TRINITY_DN450_c0_g1_i1.p1  ORF type:complete len:237 (-),score=55.31 TRINITY_DN450_c0_g1_i1:80-790(-)
MGDKKQLRSKDEDEVKKQLQNMKAFIIQEAKEKRDEIRQKAKQDFTVQKQEMFASAREKILVEYARKVKQMESNKKIKYSNMLNEQRLTVLKAREKVMDDLKDSARDELQKLSTSEDYSGLMHALLMQGLMKLNETDVLVRCRDSDKKIVSALLSKVQAEYSLKVNENTSLKIDPNNNLPPAPTKGEPLILGRYCFGGVVLSAKGGRILCDNTLDQRLNLAFAAQIPDMRKRLFPN